MICLLGPRKYQRALLIGAQEVHSAQAGGLSIGGAQVGHVAHLGGALMGVLLILALSRLPEVKSDKSLP
jgi:membrane associated rhomboid family serine protease